MSKHSRAFSSLSRSIFRSRSALNDHESTIRIQRVRFKKPPFFSPQNVRKLGHFLAAGIAFELILSYHEYKEWIRTGQGEPQFAQDWKGLFGDAKAQQEDNQPQGAQAQEGHREEEDSEEEEEEEEEDEDSVVPDEQPEDAVFIPLGLVRQREQTFYKGDDPEWKSYVDFAANKERNQNIRRDLAVMVGRNVGQGKANQRLLGKDIRVGKYWIDVDYPEGPPREYERGGIEYTDDYIAWVVRPVPAHNYGRLLRALWPEPIARSLWSSYNLLWSLQLAKIKTYLNLKGGGDDDDDDDDDQAPKPPHPPLNALGLPSSAKRDPTGPTPSPVSALPLPANAQPAQQDHPSSSVTTKLVMGESRLRSPLPAADMRSAARTFRQTLARRWKPLRTPPPRGTIFISGLVEVSGSKALCVLDVRAFYHPGEAKWLAVNIGVRRIQMRKQRARGDATRQP